MDGEQDQTSSRPVRFRPGPPSETEKTPAITLGFFNKWNNVITPFKQATLTRCNFEQHNKQIS